VLALVVSWRAEAQTPTPPQWDLTLDLRLDAEREDFSAVGLVTVSRDGRIVIPQWQDLHFLFYDARGTRLEVLGRRGRGPGDFANLLSARAGWVGDQFWVYDPGVRRLTFADSRGRLIRSIAMPASLTANVPPTGDGRRYLTAFIPHGVYPDGGILGRMSHGAHDASPNRPMLSLSTVFARSNAHGDSVRTVAAFPEVTNSVQVTRGKQTLHRAVPFAQHPLDAVAPDAQRVAFGVASVSPPGIRVMVIRQTGDTAFSRFYPVTPRRVTAAERDSALAVVAALPSQHAVAAELIDEVARLVEARMPAIHYPVRRLVLGMDDTVWLLLNEDHAAGQRWLVLDGTGAPIGMVRTPRGVNIHQASRAAVWGSETLESGLQNVVRYRIQAK
jgi:hypothetical protein